MTTTNETSRQGQASGARLARVAAIALMITSTGATPAVLADSSGRCLSVEVDAPIVMPDRSVHPSGKLTLCNSVRVTPVASVHKTYVNGQLTGMHLGHQKNSESSESTPVVFFYRNGLGQLELRGYVFPTRSGNVSYTLARRMKKENIRPTGTGSELADSQPSIPLVAMATAADSR